MNERRPESLGALCFSAVSALVLLLALAFQWNLIDLLTPLVGGLMTGLAWLLAILGTIWSVVYACRHGRKGARAFAPLAVSIGALLAAFFVPLTQFWLYANFHFNKTTREEVIAKVMSGDFTPNVAHNAKLIALPKTYGVSMGGNEIVVEGPRDQPYVFFFTFRGILDNYSGFPWVPDGAKPERFGDAADPGTEIESFGGNWYFIGHR
jgi:hypothetical protein